MKSFKEGGFTVDFFFQATSEMMQKVDEGLGFQDGRISRGKMDNAT